MTDTLINYSAENGIAWIEMDDPPANTYTHAMMRQIDEGILKARFDDDVHVIVLTGKGEKFFSAGADISMLNDVTPKFKYFFCLHANETLNKLEHTPKLVIAALNGHTVGGGLEIAMAADIRIARKGGGKIGLPEVGLGVLPGTGGTQRLARLVGKAKAFEICAGGRTFDFEAAHQMGIVNEIFEGDHASFIAQITEYASNWCPPKKASMAVGMIKRSIQSGAEVPFELGLVMEREYQAQLFGSADAKEGIASYVEKRKASFSGK